MKIKRMNKVPIQAMLSEPGPHIEPTITPSIIAANMRFHSAISNHIPIQFSNFRQMQYKVASGSYCLIAD
jgi:hypothetical protein